MDSVYFDAFVYNKLIDDKKLRKKISVLKNTGRIEVIFSEYLFNELVCTWNNKSPQRTMDLFNCVLELISDKILRQRETIINEEIKSFTDDGYNPSIFFDQIQRNEILEVMGQLANGKEITNIAPVKNIMDNKKNGHDKVKNIIRKHQPKQKIDTNTYLNFEEFYNSPEVKKEESDFIAELLTGKIIKDLDSDLIEKIKANTSNLSYFRSYLRMTSAYQYSFLVYKKPLRGDDYDLRHFVCANKVDILVSDSDFINILRWAYPQKNCFTLTEFIRHFNLQDCGTK